MSKRRPAGYDYGGIYLTKASIRKGLAMVGLQMCGIDCFQIFRGVRSPDGNRENNSITESAPKF